MHMYQLGWVLGGSLGVTDRDATCTVNKSNYKD